MSSAPLHRDGMAALRRWADGVDRLASLVERKDDRRFLASMHRLHLQFQDLKRCLPAAPDPDHPAVREARRALLRWRRVETEAREWIEEIRREAGRCRTSRSVVHTYAGGRPRRGINVQLLAHGGPDVDAR